MTFLNKHWKMILVACLTVSLVIAIIKIRGLEGKLNESLAAVAVINKRIEDNAENIKKYQHLVDSLSKNVVDKNVVIITKTDLYESTKKSGVNTRITDPELIKRLKELRSKYKTN